LLGDLGHARADRELELFPERDLSRAVGIDDLEVPGCAAEWLLRWISKPVRRVRSAWFVPGELRSYTSPELLLYLAD
jgi:hypothetical protein